MDQTLPLSGNARISEAPVIACLPKLCKPYRKACRLEANGETSDDHEDAGQEEDKDEEDGAAFHCDPVLDEEGEDVAGGGQRDPHLPPALLLLLLSQVKAELFWLARGRPKFVLLYLNGSPRNVRPLDLESVPTWQRVRKTCSRDGAW